MDRDEFCQTLEDEINGVPLFDGQADAEYEGDGHIVVRFEDGPSFHINVTSAK